MWLLTIQRYFHGTMPSTSLFTHDCLVDCCTSDMQGGIAKSALQAIAIHRRGVHKGQKKYTKRLSAEEVVASWDGAGKVYFS